jgi:hypothetical protein
VLESLGASSWQARWLAREGTPLTDWFPVVAEQGFPELKFLMDGSLVLRFRSPTFPYESGPWKYRFEDAKAAVSAVPDWLTTRDARALYVIRAGRGYASWGGQGGQCGSSVEVLSTSGKSCGCLQVPNLSDLASVGRDGSLIVPLPPAQHSTCQYDLHQQLLK